MLLSAGPCEDLLLPRNADLVRKKRSGDGHRSSMRSKRKAKLSSTQALPLTSHQPPPPFARSEIVKKKAAGILQCRSVRSPECEQLTISRIMHRAAFPSPLLAASQVRTLPLNGFLEQLSPRPTLERCSSWQLSAPQSPAINQIHPDSASQSEHVLNNRMRTNPRLQNFDSLCLTSRWSPDTESMASCSAYSTTGTNVFEQSFMVGSVIEPRKLSNNRSKVFHDRVCGSVLTGRLIFRRKWTHRIIRMPGTMYLKLDKLKSVE